MCSSLTLCMLYTKSMAIKLTLGLELKLPVKIVLGSNDYVYHLESLCYLEGERNLHNAARGSWPAGRQVGRRAGRQSAAGCPAGAAVPSDRWAQASGTTWKSWSWSETGWRRWWRRSAGRTRCGWTPGWSWNL